MLDDFDKPGVLISVRSASEARLALSCGASVIDVKEPARGPLGAADPDVMAAVVAAVQGRAPVSVAAGELVDVQTFAADLKEVSFVKLGLAGCASIADWPARWRATIARWPPRARPVAVAYADWQRAAAPPPETVLQQAISFGCPALLVDTWHKQNGCLFDIWEASQVAHFSRRVRRAGMAIVLAGALHGPTLETAVQCGADLVGVRGAACEGGRGGALSAERTRAICASVRRLSLPPRGVVASTPAKALAAEFS